MRGATAIRIAAAICFLPALTPSRAVAAESSPLFEWTAIAAPAPAQSFRLAALGDRLLAFPLERSAGEIAFLPVPIGHWSLLTIKASYTWNQFSQVIANDSILVSNGTHLYCLPRSRQGHTSRDGFLILLADDTLTISDLPTLPEPVGSGAGAVLGDTLHLMGSTVGPLPKPFWWTLDLAAGPASSAWAVEPTPTDWASQTTSATVQDGLLVVLAGTHVLGTIAPGETHLTSSNTHGKPIPALPMPADAPVAIPIGPSHVVVMDEGNLLRSYAYHTITNTWREIKVGLPEGATPPGPVQITPWRGGMVLATNDGLLFGEPRRETRGLSAIDIAVLLSYLVVLTLMGFYFARREQGSSDYFLAGRRIPWWAAGLSLLGTSISAITFMAIPALVYRTDWVYLIGNLMIVAVAPPVIAYYLPFYRRLNVTSAYEYLELRFGLATRLVGSATFLLYQMGRMGVVIYLPALALSAVTAWNVYLCIVAIGVLATLYTTLGGIEAVIWTDVLQVIVLLGGALASLFVIISLLPGGAANLLATAAAEGKLTAINLSGGAATTALWVVIFGNFFKFLIPYSSDQAVIQRYLTTSDEKQAARGIWLNAAASVPVWTTFFALGTALWAFYRAFPEKLDVVGKTDEIFAWFIVHELPVGITGLVVAALFAAAMSTLDSGMNSMATAITTDFYRRFRPTVGDRSCLNAARLATILLGLMGTALAAYLAAVETQSIWDRFLEIMGLFGGGLAGMFMAGIFTRRTHQTGILIGFAASAAALYFARASGTVHLFLYGAIGIFTCAGVGWLASLCLAGPEKDLAGLTIHDPPSSSQ